MRGIQVSQQLRLLGFDSKVLEAKDANSINDSILIWVKFFDPNKAAKLGSNFHLLDAVDAFPYNKDKINNKLLSGLILNNKYMREECINKFKYTKPIFVIPHHWDKDLLKVNKKNENQLNFGYLGSISSLKYDQNLLHFKSLAKEAGVKFLDCEFCKNVTDYIKDGFSIRDPQNHERLNIKNLEVNFNCHISVRKESSQEYLYKTSAKIATASCMGHNIITTPEKSVQDVLPSNYPFLLADSQFESVLSMIERTRNDYENKKEMWNFGLSIMSEVKNLLSIESIAPLYSDIISFFSQKNT